MKPVTLLYLLLFEALVSLPTGAVSDTAFTTTDDSPVVPYQDSPAMQERDVIATVQAIDRVKEMVQVQDQAGRTLGFYVESVTPMNDAVGRQIGLEHLHPGDVVGVRYLAENFALEQLTRLKAVKP